MEPELDGKAAGVAEHQKALAGHAEGVPAESYDLQIIDKARRRNAWDLKVFGDVNLYRALHAAMRDGGAGAIIDLTGLVAKRLDSNYMAGLAGNALLIALYCTLGSLSFKDGLRVVAIRPEAVKRICIRLALWPARRILSPGAARLYRLR